MIIKDVILNDARRGTRAFTLVEVLISVGILAFMMVSLYASFAFGFASLATTREDLRATQLLMQKVEAVRLCTWAQLSNCPATFSDKYDPLGGTNGTGVVYGGTLNTTGVATNIPGSASYQSQLHLITVTVSWTNYTGKTPIVHFRQFQTLSAYSGLQNYVYGTTN